MQGLNASSTLTRLLMLVAGGIVVLAGCAPTAPGRSAENESAVAKPPGPPKTLRIATVREPVDGIALFSGSGDAGFQLTSMFHAGLTAYDGQGNLIPRVATKVPSVADGDWKMLPDGGMEVTWKLRPNVRWHDGTPLSAQDFALGIQIAKDRELPLPRAGGIALVNDVTVPDDETLVIRWSEPYFGGNVGNPADFPAVPRHIVGDLYRQTDKQPFINSPYWSMEFVGIGPYRMSQWVQGAFTEGVAFDDYFLGRPKIDRVIIRYFQDANTLVTSMISGDSDLVTIGTLKMEDIEPIANAWGPQGGKVIPSITDAMMSRFQYRDPDAPWVRDVRVRQALVHLIDRPVLAETFSPVGGVADIFAAKNDPVYAIADQRGFPRYPYDLARGERLLNEAGWTRGTDGVFANGAGQRLNIEVRVVESTPLNTRMGLALVDQWKRGGLDVDFFSVGKNATNKAELKAIAPGVFHQADTMTPDTFDLWRSSLVATAQNRWSGRNISTYSNAEFDRLQDQLGNELDPSRRLSHYADLLRFTTQEAVFITEFYDVASAVTAHRAGIRGPGPVLPVSKVATWNIHEWEMD